VLAALIASPLLLAQDFFEQKKRELAVQAQQTTQEVTGALAKSRQLEKTSAAEAKALLEKCLLTVNDSNALDDKQRADLRGQLLARIREVDASVREQHAKTNTGSQAAADKAAREAKERADAAKVQDQQKSVYNQSKDRVDNAKKAADTQKQINQAQQQGFLNIATDLAKSAANTTESRANATTVMLKDRRQAKLSKEDAALLKALNSTISVDFDGGPATFKSVLEYISDKTGLNIFPDAASMRDAGVEYSTPVKFKANKVTVKTLLKKILADVGLTYVIMEGNLQIITPDRTKDYLVVRHYPVQDLIAPVNTRLGPIANQVQMANQANALIQMIRTSIEPNSWEGQSERGYGSIVYNPATMSLTIRHTAEMHFMLGGGVGR